MRDWAAKLQDVELRDEDWYFVNEKLANPIRWVQEVSENKEWKMDLVARSPCHGDLHVGNIFLLPDDSPRLIDFGLTGMGHVFRDFAALEASLRLTCINENDRERIHQAEELLCDVSSLTDYIDYRQISDDPDKGSPDLREVLRIILDIRRAAADACGEQPGDRALVEYFLALVLHLLRYATGKADEVHSDDKAAASTRVWHAMYAAAKTADAARAIMNPNS